MSAATDAWSLIPDELREPLRSYLHLLVAWSRKIDLVAPAAEQTLVARHLLDGLELLKLVPPGEASVLDVGSGAGLPGLIWAVARPDLSLVLLEPRGRRVAFLRTAVRQLGLRRVQIRQERAEALFADGEVFDEVVGRAVAPYASWLQLAGPLVRVGGHLHAQAGEQPPLGWNDPEHASRFSLRPDLEHVYQLPEIGTRRALRLERLPRQ